MTGQQGDPAPEGVDPSKWDKFKELRQQKADLEEMLKEGQRLHDEAGARARAGEGAWDEYNKLDRLNEQNQAEIDATQETINELMRQMGY